MANNDNEWLPSGRYSLSGHMLPLAGIGVILLVAVAGYAWAGGWFMPGRLDQNAVVDTFQQVNGVYPGFRRNHAKGVCATGWFDGNGNAARLSRSPVFEAGRLPVFGRVALAGGMPSIADGPGAVRSIAINFSLPDGEAWRIGTINIPVFPMKDPQAFHEQLLATAPDPATGKPDPAKVKAFFDANPESAKALEIIKAYTFSSGFADSTYFGLNAFRLVDSAGVSTPVRWSLVPVDAVAPEAQPTPTDPNYLFDGLNARIAQAPVEWHLVLTVGQPGDPTNDATLPWPADREQIDVGTLTLNAIEPEAPGNCRDINFDPLVLPDGIEPSDDPLLSARSATYSVSFTRRAREPHTPSAVESGAASPAGKGS
ncbi:catalase family peroxidase [Mesorhizobium sp. IMUNJ 23232]|uniref:catalase family peroxidase n=1 Tax=Mesorhizobium sp. IMUNJ 23232 TaxID=3376064 RepID=UPI0037A7D716